MAELIYRAEVFQEGDLYVARCPHLDVSSFGESPQEAKVALQEAVQAFLEGCELIGSLEDVLEESGFVREHDTWLLRERISEEMAVTLP